MKRILLIEVNRGLWKPGLYCRHTISEPLGLEYIGALVKRYGHDVEIIQQRDLSEIELLEKIYTWRPAIVGFSVLTYNANATIKLCRNIKNHNPRIITVVGGYHPTAVPSVVKSPNIDYAILGEGEKTFIELLHCIKENKDPYQVKGIAFYDDKVIVTKPQKRIRNLDGLPAPLRSRTIMEGCHIDGLVYPPPSQQNCIAQVLYSRGCIHNCAYCCSPNLWGNDVRFRTPKNVIKELKYLKREFETNLIFFADLTFNLNPKRSFELCRELVRSNLCMNWYAMCRVDHCDEETISIMENAGCTRIAFGIDALSDTIFERIKPHQKIGIDLVKRSLGITQCSSIITRAFLIIGYPWETKQDLFEAKELIKTLPIDELRIGILTPLPGSIMYEEFKEEGLLLHEDFSKYTTEECVIKLKDVPPQELYEIREQMFRVFYQSREYEHRMKEKIRKYPHLKQSYYEFFEFLDNKGVFEQCAVETLSR